MNARQLQAEYFDNYDNKTAYERAAFKARVTRLAKRSRRETEDGMILEDLAYRLGYEPAFLDDLQKHVTLQPQAQDIPVVRVQLIRDSAIATERAVRSPAEIAQLLIERYGLADRELFICVHLDTRNQVLSVEVVAQGTLNSTLVTPREIFKGAILANAAAVILAHNHPSGMTDPSADDCIVTEQLRSAGKVMDIEVLDHVVFSSTGFTSLRERGLCGW
jgi:DNA repair protein RadC